MAIIDALSAVFNGPNSAGTEFTPPTDIEKLKLKMHTCRQRKDMRRQLGLIGWMPAPYNSS